MENREGRRHGDRHGDRHGAARQVGDVDRMFRARIAPHLKGIEADRLQALASRRGRWFWALWGIALAAGLAGYGAIHFEWSWAAPFVVTIGSVVLAWSWAEAPIGSYERKLASWLLEQVGGALDAVHYEPDAGRFSLADFDAAQLLPTYNRQAIEDRFHGSYRQCRFQMVHANLRLKSSGRSSSSRTVFDGVLVEISTPRATRGRIVIARDRGRLGNILSGLFKPGQRVEIAHAEFESSYEVYAEYPDEALQFVSRPFVENFIALQETTGSEDIVAAFQGATFLLAVNSVNGFAQHVTVHTPVERLKEALELAIHRVSVIFRIIDRLHGDE